MRGVLCFCITPLLSFTQDTNIDIRRDVQLLVEPQWSIGYVEVTVPLPRGGHNVVAANIALLHGLLLEGERGEGSGKTSGVFQ